MIPDSFKQDLLNRVDVVDVVQRYVQLRKAGANYVGLCPFHNEKTPSFSVSPTKQFYHCFGCGAHGNAIGFLMAYAGMGYVDAIKDLASSVGMQNNTSGGRHRITVIAAMAMLSTSCRPWKRPRPRGSVYFVWSFRKISGPR